MSRIVGMAMTPRRMRWRARIVPVASTMAGSLTALLPVVATWPLMPPFGLVMLLAWRLPRPGLWAAWVALPLGLFDDLASGQPVGSAMLIWPALLIGIDLVDRWLLWRDAVQDWAVAGVAIPVAIVAMLGLAFATGGGHDIRPLVPQIVATLLLFPLAQRVAAVLDRWRLLT